MPATNVISTTLTRFSGFHVVHFMLDSWIKSIYTWDIGCWITDNCWSDRDCQEGNMQQPFL